MTNRFLNDHPDCKNKDACARVDHHAKLCAECHFAARRARAIRPNWRIIAEERAHAIEQLRFEIERLNQEVRSLRTQDWDHLMAARRAERRAG